MPVDDDERRVWEPERIIAASALAARTYGRPGTLVLDVGDVFCPWNAGRWRLAAGEDGRGVVEPTTAVPDVTLDAGDLGATYLGTFPFSDLARVGRAVEGTSGAILCADTLFAAPRAPWCGTMF